MRRKNRRLSVRPSRIFVYLALAIDFVSLPPTFGRRPASAGGTLQRQSDRAHPASDPSTMADVPKGGLRDFILDESRGYDIDSPDNTPKRAGYLSWDDYFMAVAHLSALRSKDPRPSERGRSGACIVDGSNRVVGIGYDGFPRGCPDDCLPWASADDVDAGGDGVEWLHGRDAYLCRAEINAILNKCSSDVVGARIFAPNFPCKKTLPRRDSSRPVLVPYM